MRIAKIRIDAEVELPDGEIPAAKAVVALHEMLPESVLRTIAIGAGDEAASTVEIQIKSVNKRAQKVEPTTD